MGEAGGRFARLGSLADRPGDLSSPQRHPFRVPPNPEVGFDGILVHCEVLECEPPSRLAFSWSARPLREEVSKLKWLHDNYMKGLVVGAVLAVDGAAAKLLFS